MTRRQSIFMCAMLVLLLAMPAIPLGATAVTLDGGHRSSGGMAAYLTVAVSPEPVVVHPPEMADVTLTFREYNNVVAHVRSMEIAFLTVRGESLPGSPVRLALTATVEAGMDVNVTTGLGLPTEVVQEAVRLGHHRLYMDMRFQVEDATGHTFMLLRRVMVEIEPKVAVLVDEEVHPFIAERLARYELDVNARMPVDFIEVKGSWSTPEAVRDVLKRLWREEGISGAILVGHPPFATWEYDRGQDGVELCPIPIFYEDLDGSFADTDSDGYYDRHYWGANDGPEIWVSFMMPPREAIPSTNLDPYSLGEGGGLLGSYYTLANFKALTLTRTDPSVDFYWERDASSVFSNPDGFSVLWTGSIKADLEEDYTIAPFCGGGIRMWLDGELVLDQRNVAPWNWREYTIDVHLTKGWHAVRMEYNENGWGLGHNGAIRLAWSSPSVLGANLNNYLDKSHAYYTDELEPPERGLLFFDHAYGVECRMLDPIKQMMMDPLYGENLLVADCNRTTSGSDYLEHLDMGAELVSVWSHAGSGGHWMPPKDEVPGNISGASTWLVRQRDGGVVTLIWGCQAGDFGTSPEGYSSLSENLAVNYAHSGRYGLASMACTRSFGTTFRETYFALQNRSCLATGYFAYKDYCYDAESKKRTYPQTGYDRWIDDEVLLGDPFITVDHYPTGLAVSIEDGTKYTDSTSVILGLAADGATEMRLRNEGGAWTQWRSFCETIQWELRQGYGGTSVHLEARNGYGVALEAASDAICRVASTLDVEGVVLARGAEYTSSRETELVVALEGGNPEQIEMRVRNEEEPWGGWGAFASPLRWTLSMGDGEKTVRVQLRDASGILTTEAQDTVLLDTRPPRTAVGLEGVDGRDGWYTSAVRVTLTATDDHADAPVTRYRLDGGDWDVYLAPFEVVDDGNHLLEYLSEDKAGNEEAPSNVTIDIDTRPPELRSLVLGDGTGHTTSAKVEVTVIADDGTSGMGAMTFSEDGDPWGTWDDFHGASIMWFLAVDGERTLRVRVRDAAGNEAATTLSASITIDVTPPRMVATSPQMEAVGVPLATKPSVEFSEPIDLASLGEDGFIVRGTDGARVEGVVVHDEDLRTFTFEPSAPIGALTTYTVTLSREVRDLAGNVLMGGAGLTWSFSTEGVPPSAPSCLTIVELNGTVHLVWEAPADPGSGTLTGYQVYRGPVTGTVVHERTLIARVTSTSYVDRSVGRNASYAYHVVACNPFGDGPASDIVQVDVPAVARPPGPPMPPGNEDGEPLGPAEPMDAHVSGDLSMTSIAMIVAVLGVIVGATTVILSKRNR